MEQIELLRLVTTSLDELGIPYFVTGSSATIYYGENRFTHDVDIVADLDERTAVELCRRFPSPDYYVSEHAALQAVRLCGQFNIIRSDSALKADIIVPARTALDRSRFSRRRRLPVGEQKEAYFTSPEDAIIKKMEYYKEGESEKHLRDITGVMLVSGDQLDYAYIEQWAKELDVMEIWRRLQERVAQAKARMPKPE